MGIRAEIDKNICNLHNVIQELQEAWGEGDTKEFADTKKIIVETLTDAENLWKDDLYREACR